MQRDAGATWTLLGDLASPARLAVDPAGSLWVPGLQWGLDWWIGADDRWHVPAREPAVRQALVDDCPIVQTTVKVPSGDLHQQVVVVPGARGPEAAVEIRNDSAAPVALALVIRPVTLAGLGAVDRVELRGSSLLVAGCEVLTLPEPPRRALLGTGAGVDPLVRVMAGEAGEAEDAEIVCPDGLAWAVVIVPIAHRATWSYRVALEPSAPHRPPVGAAHRPPVGAAHRPPVEVAAAARGWRAQVEREVRLDLPADRVTGVLAGVRAHLLLAAGADLSGAEGAEVAVAAASAGLGLADPGRLIEAARGQPIVDVSAAGGALWAAARLVGLGAPRPDVRAVAGLAESLARGAAGAAPDSLDRAWATAGSDAAARLLAAAGERRAAATATEWHRRAARDLDGEAAILASALGAAPPVLPPAAPLLMPPRGGDAGAAVVDPARSVLWAAADLRAGGAGWYERMAAVTALATPTLAWPDLCSPGQAGGCGTVGHSPLVTARVWAAVRAGLLAEGQGVGVLPGWPAAWLGRALEVHGLPSAFGAVSFAVRWHGARPALLWAVAGGPEDLVVTAPGLDPAWRGSGPSGEALLAAPAGGPVAEGTVQ